MKKILALVVAFALCLTAISGCFTAIAAEAAPDAALSIAFGSENLPWQPGETTVTVSGTGYANYAAQELSVSFPEALVFKSITGIDQYDAVGGENYKVVTAEGITTVTLIQETPADAFDVVFNVAYAINNSGKNKTYTVEASAEVGTDADEPVLYTVTAEPASVVQFTQHAAKAAWESDDVNHWHDCVCSEADCELAYDVATHNFVEGVCDVCGAAEPEAPVEPEVCQHANTTTTTVDATCNTAGSTTVVCDDCGETVSTEEIPAKDHDYTYISNNDGTHSATCANGCSEDIVNEAHTTNGVCVCGIDTRLVFGTPSLTYGSASLEFLFLVSNTVLDLYDNVTVEILPEKYNSSTGNLIENVETIVIQEADLAKQGSKNRGYTYKEAFLYELGLNIQYMLKAYDAQGNLLAVSEKFNTSGGAIMKAFHAQAVQYNMPEFATLITDTIIVADEAIKSMAIGKAAGSYICTAESILLGYDTSDKTQSYESYNTVDDFEPSYAGVSKDKSATHRILQGVTIGKLPYLSISIKDTANALDINKLQFTISYTKLSGNGTSTEFNQTFTAADGSIVDGSYIAFNFEDIGVQNSDKNITINVDYDGQDFYDAVYSVETFLGSQLTNENTGSLADALIKLGVSFKNYATK